MFVQTKSLVSNAFRYCTSLQRIDLSNIQSNIAFDTFQQTRIQFVYIPLVKNIGYTGYPATYNAFYGCSNLIGVMVKSCTAIGGSIFYGSSIKYVIINQNNIPSLIANTTQSPRVYVPDEMFEQYKSAEGWSAISSKISHISQFRTDYPNETYWEGKW